MTNSTSWVMYGLRSQSFRIRYVLGETTNSGKPPSRPCECLPDHRKRLREAIKELGLNEPSTGNIMKALGEYKMFTHAELAEIEKEIVI